MNNTTTMEYIAAVEAGNFPDDPRVPLDHKFEDERGVIKNLLHTPIMSVAMITSKKGTERANHFHRSNSHFAYVVSGKIEYFERDIEGKERAKSWIIMPGEVFYTRPMVLHKMLFLQDTVFLTFAPGLKDHDAYEEDIVRMKF